MQALGDQPVMVVVLTVSSVQLMMIGILGEYLGRLYMQSERRPLYIVGRLIAGKAPDKTTDKTADKTKKRRPKAAVRDV